MPSPPRSFSASFSSSADLFYDCTTSSISTEDLSLVYTPPSRSSLKIGVVILSQQPTQLMDFSALDLLATIGRNRISQLDASTASMDNAVDEIDIRYVTASGEGSFPVTCGGRIPVTNSFQNAPDFNIIYIPGSFSTTTTTTTTPLPPQATLFLALQTSRKNFLALLSIASAILPLTHTPLLTNRRAAAPRTFLCALKQRCPETSWHTTPWERDGFIWTCNSAVSALDMVRAFMRGYFWDRGRVVEGALSAAGIGGVGWGMSD